MSELQSLPVIVKLRQWIEVCKKSGIGVPEQVLQFDAYSRLLEAEIAHLRAAPKPSWLEMVVELRRLGDTAYMCYSEHSKQVDCLGADAKIQTGRFCRDELIAHMLAQEWLGKHKAYHDAAACIQQAQGTETI